MSELLKQGLYVDSKDHHGITPIEIAMEQNHVDMVKLLVMSGADVTGIHTHEFCASTLSEMMKKREIGHVINIREIVLRGPREEDRELIWGRYTGLNCPRASICRGHPILREGKGAMEAGKLIRLPDSF
ncbi:PREDICTED: potassium channel AKT2/3-like [Lupinus angustifolius]|uniref:potassium channel AKT2/3-like n=1 Tax=Lupinus angustifolius TaxID=3871 RepID=UPI00092E22F2|nr:PREDICTED: potassium channel AKT2/3-like [Lupinus angustifolius]